MNEALIRAWAHAPWNSWLKDEPAWVDLFAELLARLPAPALRRVLSTLRPLIVLPPVSFGRVLRITQPLTAGAHILQLDARLLERSREEALGILAHELAHLCVPEAHDDELQNDLDADQLALEWGFRKELERALRADLDAEHPRVARLADRVA